jgi:Ca2+-binding EF-hand superfamily protein
MKKVIIGLMMFSAPVMAQDRVAQYDFDKDGKVSFEDLNRYCDVSKSLFDRADKNGDGALSNSEMRSARGYLFTRCNEPKKDA